jgi:hypothetical protein
VPGDVDPVQVRLGRPRVGRRPFRQATRSAPGVDDASRPDERPDLRPLAVGPVVERGSVGPVAAGLREVALAGEGRVGVGRAHRVHEPVPVGQLDRIGVGQVAPALVARDQHLQHVPRA